MWKNSALAHNVCCCSGVSKLSAPPTSTLAKQLQLPLDMGGANGKVAYIGMSYNTPGLGGA